MSLRPWPSKHTWKEQFIPHNVIFGIGSKVPSLEGSLDGSGSCGKAQERSRTATLTAIMTEGQRTGPWLYRLSLVGRFEMGGAAPKYNPQAGMVL